MNSHLSSSYTLLYHLFCHNLQNGDHVVLRFIFLLTSIQVDFFCDRFCKHFCRPTASLMAASSHATKLLRNSSRNMTMSHKSARIIPIPGGPTSKPTRSKNSPCQAPQDTPDVPYPYTDASELFAGLRQITQY